MHETTGLIVAVLEAAEEASTVARITGLAGALSLTRNYEISYGCFMREYFLGLTRKHAVLTNRYEG